MGFQHGIPRTGWRGLCAVAAVLGGLLSSWTGAAGPAAQTAPDALAQRAAARIQTLQREADALASRERSLLDELRQLEIEREIQIRTREETERQLAAVEAELAALTDRIDELGRQADAQKPDIAARIVELYKTRNGGYLRVLLNVGDLGELARAYRLVSAMQRLDALRLDQHRRTLADLRRSEAGLREQQTRLAGLRQAAAEAAHAAARAAAARSAMVARIDSRRDTNARLIGELRMARQKLQETVDGLGTGGETARPPAVLPIAPFRGALDWPVNGTLLSRFGRPGDSRAKASILSSGLQIGAPRDTPVRAVHEGTVSFAEPFSGFGNLVIVDHGALAYSLYGQLADIAVERGRTVSRGGTVGTVGMSVDGTPALYFELRIDAKPVDPLQWLKQR